jgi:pilus assembly protein FimV
MRGLATIIILASALIVTSVYSQNSTQLKGPKGVDYGVQGRTIGPIKPTDTLWRIAAKVRPDNSVTIYQVMQALYNKNPQSFLDQNLNHMQYGAYLKIPTLAEINSVSPQLAKQRSEQDDKLWTQKKNGTLTQAQINTAQTQVTQARKVDVEDAKKAIQQELNAIKTDQGNKLVELQQQFKSSVSNVEEILVENSKLKQQLSGISKELDNLRQQLGQDSEIQQQLKELIVKQNEIIAQQKEKQAAQQASGSFADLLSNPLVLILLMTIPGLLIIFAVVMFLRKRANNTEPDSQNDDEFLPQTPVYNSDDNLNTENLDDPIIPDSDPLDDLSVRLDEGAADDALLDDDVLLDDDTLDDSLLEQDELESLLSDDIIFDDENAEDDELDIFMQPGFDEAPDDSLDETIDLDLPDTKSNDDILSADELDSLFDEDDSLPDIAPIPATAKNDSAESNDEISAFSEELANEDFDIDDILDAEQALPADDSADDLKLDDVESLIDEPDAALDDVDLDDLDLNDDLDDLDLNDDLDDLDLNDDSAGIESESAAENAPNETATEQQHTAQNADKLPAVDEDIALDDIDALIDEPDDALDDVDLEDLDLNDDSAGIESESAVENAPNETVTEQQQDAQNADKLPAVDEDIALDDIDALIDEPDATLDDVDLDNLGLNDDSAGIETESAAENTPNETATEQQDPQSSDKLPAVNEDIELDDIDALIDEEDDALDDVDLDDLNLNDVSAGIESESAAENAPNETVTEQQQDAQNADKLPAVDEDIALDDIDALIDEPESEQPQKTESNAQVGSPVADELDDVERDDFSDTSPALLDAEDALEEYNDDNLKSVDELLNELQQVEDEEQAINAEQWQLDELDDDIEEVEVDLGDDPLAAEHEETAPLDEDLTAPEPAQAQQDYTELALDDDHIVAGEEQSALLPEELQGDDLDGEAKGMPSSQAEQDLANALLNEASLDSLEADFDDELLLDNDFSAFDSELDNEQQPSTADSQFNDDDLAALLNEVEQTHDEQLTAVENSDTEFEQAELDETLSNQLDDEQTNADREAELTQADDLDHHAVMVSDDELDDEFMADLSQTDFDSLLNELAEPEDLQLNDSSEYDVDFNTLLTDEPLDDAVVGEEVLDKAATDSTADAAAVDEEVFVDIDSLLDQSDEAELDHEPYDEVNMDVGLGEFDALLAGDNPTDVDAESGGYSAKLDLARAYIEIDDYESALKIVSDVIDKGPEEVQQEALSLKAKLK